MKPLSLSTVIAALAVMTTTPAQADEYLTGYVGYFNVLDSEENATQFGIEYRMEPFSYGIRPVIGANLTNQGAAYGYGGLNWDIELMNNELYIIPNFMVGLYSDGDGKDLGGPIEFRSGIELAYQLGDGDRVGIAFNHISNASIYDKNPGSEVLLINYSVVY